MKILVTLIFLFMSTMSSWAGVNFDGSDDYLHTDVGLPLNIRTDSEGGFGCWFNVNSLSSNVPIAGFFVNAGDNNNNIFVQIQTDGDIEVGVKGGAGNLIRATVAAGIGTDEWHHVIWTNDTSGNRLYLDGVLQSLSYSTGSASTDAWLDNMTSEDIFQTAKASFAAASYGSVKISEGFYNSTAITNSQASLLANSRIRRMPLQISSSTLRIYWPLDDHPHNDSANSANGLVFKDRSKENNDGTASGCNAQAEEVLSYQ